MFMGDAILESLHQGEPTDDIDDILPSHYDEITLLMLRAALFEQGWIWLTHHCIQPIDTLALGDIGYVTEAGEFVLVDNMHYCLQAKSRTLSWDGNLEFMSGRNSLEDTSGENIVSKRGNVYYR